MASPRISTDSDAGLQWGKASSATLLPSCPHVTHKVWRCCRICQSNNKSLFLTQPLQSAQDSPSLYKSPWFRRALPRSSHSAQLPTWWPYLIRSFWSLNDLESRKRTLQSELLAMSTIQIIQAFSPLLLLTPFAHAITLEKRRGGSAGGHGGSGGSRSSKIKASSDDDDDDQVQDDQQAGEGGGFNFFSTTTSSTTAWPTATGPSSSRATFTSGTTEHPTKKIGKIAAIVGAAVAVVVILSMIACIFCCIRCRRANRTKVTPLPPKGATVVPQHDVRYDVPPPYAGGTTYPVPETSYHFGGGANQGAAASYYQSQGPVSYGPTAYGQQSYSRDDESLLKK